MHGPDTSFPQLGYAGGRLDRADHIRTDPEAVARALASPAARVLVLDGLDPVWEDGSLLNASPEAAARPEDHVLLGIDEGHRPIFARLVEDKDADFAPSARSRAITAELPAHEVA
ncbi:MAG TPA: NADH pyrophosphatase, partial [Sphingobium sp.]|nr:NADH pyrophosphatase [Sphingobium sp.]